MFRSLAIANYRLWFAGALVSNVGAWMQRTAQDWLILTELTDNDAAAVGFAIALQFAPPLLLVPFTGLVADRFDRRRVLLVTQSAMGLLGLGLGIIVVAGVAELWMVYGFALGLGIAFAFDGPARQTFVAELVPKDHLPNAVALNATSFHGARLAGPAVAGLLTAALGAGPVFLINAATFGAVIIAVLALRPSSLYPAHRATAGRGRILEGFRYVRSRPDIMVILVMVFLIGTFSFNFPIYTATMARVEFQQGAEGYGILSSILAIGSVAGALLAARRERPRMRIVVGAAAGVGLATGAAALMPSYWSFAVVLTLIGLSSITMMTSANGYVQSTTEPEMRGRVMALYMAIFMGGTPLGAPLVGWVANAFGARWSMGIAAAGALLAATIGVVWWLRSRHPRFHVEARRRRVPRIVVDYPREVDERELATSEIAVVEAHTHRS